MQKFPLGTSRWMMIIHLLFCFVANKASSQIASFNPNTNSGCAPLQVNLTNLTIGAIGFQWNLGNGNTPTAANPSANYSAPGTYIITLTATFPGGIVSTASDTITVHPNPVADFITDSLFGCEDDRIFTFTNGSSGATSYIWDFGDGQSSTVANPQHTYSSPGNFCVKLIAVNASGCRQIKTQSNCITVHPAPQANITASQTSTCDSNTVFQFNGQGTAITEWLWDFGDGDSSNLPSPTHQYGSTGQFQVNLIVENGFGCVDTTHFQSLVSIGPTLVPSFTIDDSSGCIPLNVQFTSTVPGATSWTWDFGDGNSSNTSQPLHNYNQSGSFSITLTVTTQSGCNGSITLNNLINADPIPVVDFSVDQDTGCAPFTTTFHQSCQGAVLYNWEFGNGQTGTGTDPSTTYPQGGSYPVTLTATTSNGCSASVTKPQFIRVLSPRATFTGNPLTGCPGMTVNFQHTAAAGQLVNYEWDFGDGTTGSGPAPSHTYSSIGSYTVSLIVTHAFGCKDTIIRTGFVNVVVPAGNNTYGDTTMLCQNMPMVFVDPTSGSTSWIWDLGDGTTSTSQNPAVMYPGPGFYTVSLQTTMPGGCNTVFNPLTVVQVIEYDPKPIDLNFTNPCKPYTVSFSNNTPNVNAYLWDFGDGQTSTQAAPVHTYQQAGTYQVSLSVMVGAGCYGTITTTIVVGHTNPIQISDADICLGDPILFTLNTPLAFTSASWDFGNGLGSTALQPSYTYPSGGQYSVRVITTDTDGCIDTFLFDPVTVNDPIPGYTGPAHACVNSPVNLTSTALNADSIRWDFGDGNSAQALNPVYAYSQPGLYTITQTLYKNSCVKTHSWAGAIRITQPESRFSYTASGTCLPVTLQFTDQSTSAVSWSWDLGDGQTSNSSNPVHTYTNAVNDSIRLTVTDRYGCTDQSTQAPFPHFAATASADRSQGCSPLTVQFSDASNGAISWNWLFGDGNTSTAKNPQHTYQGNGIYTVTLIAAFPGGCIDTIVYYDMISVNSPQADFYSPTLAGCSPTQISFVNTTSDADTFRWYFGDGAVSNGINPQNIYYIPGTYTVTLVAINSFGCKDSIVKQDYITIPGTVTNFGISTTNGCQGAPIQFTDSSVNASTWSWDLGDGPLQSAEQPSHVYDLPGTYTVTLITWDSTGCSSAFTYPTPLVIHPKPEAAAAAADSTLCSYEPLQLNNLSQGAVSFEWHFGDGQTDTTTNPNHFYQSPGTFHPWLVATNQMGCRDTFAFTRPIDGLITPEADFMTNERNSCFGSTIRLINTSTGIEQASYAWDFGFGTSTQENPAISSTMSGNFDVSLIVLNNNGCSDTTTKPTYILVYDTIPPPADPIASASVSGDHIVELTWFSSSDPEVSQYRIHRYNTVTQTWNLVHTDSIGVQNSGAITRTYRDTVNNTRWESYSYKVQTVDICGNAIALENLTPHTTINISTQVNSMQVEVNWTPYEGCTFDFYRLYRTENNSAAPLLLATLPSTQLTFTDTTLICPYPVQYRVEAIDLCGKPFNAWSDTSVAIPVNPLEMQQSDLVRTTVVDNRHVLTEWLPPALQPERVLEYHIMRATDGVHFLHIATLPATNTSYLDQDTDPTGTSYSYRILVVNDCLLSGKESNRGTSILLQGNWQEYKTRLTWTPYSEWDTGVQKYILEVQDAQGNWTPLHQTGGQDTVIEFME